MTIIETPGQSIHLLRVPNQTASYSSLPGSAQPASRAIGASQPQAISAPRSMEAPARMPMIAPTATISGDQSNTKPRFAIE